jgi:nitrile hydratase accessory protein
MSDQSAPALQSEQVFNAPWEAQAFALAVSLHERGAFTWTEWAAELGQVIAEVRARAEPDTGAEYYRHWMTALERLALKKGLVAGRELDDRRIAWDEAARATPHGKPIELRPSGPRR